MEKKIGKNPWDADFLKGAVDPDYNVIVDSCIWIDRLRAGRDIRQELLPLLRADMLDNCGIIRAKVLRGVHPLIPGFVIGISCLRVGRRW